MSNPFVTNFASELMARYGKANYGQTNAEWIAENTKLLGRNFSFEGHEFQIDILNDQAVHTVVKKCSQVGLTEIIIRWTLAFLARNQGLTTIMTQPTRQMALNFSTTRVDEIIKEAPLLSNLLDYKVDSKELKKLGKSYLYIKGTKGASSAISVPADAIVTDEYDFSDMAVVGKYNSRLSHSKHKIIKRFSTPTIPDFGVTKEFEMSTQNQRLQKCPHCNHWNLHDFFRDVKIMHKDYYDVPLDHITADDLVMISPDDVVILCEKCRKPIHYHEYLKQEWVATHPGRFISGYQVRPWHTETQRPFDLLRSRADYELYSDWVNFALGEDYIDANQIFDLEKLELGHYAMADSYGLFIGIDFGKDCYIVVGFKTDHGLVIPYYAKISEHKIKDTVKELIYKYYIAGMVVDALPQTKLASDIIDLLPGKAHTCYYSDNQKDYFALKANDRDVTVNRTQLYDKVLSIDSIEINDSDEFETYKQHMHGMIKQRLKDDEVEAVRYVKVKPDHFLHATGYMKLAADIFGDSITHIAMPSITTTKIK